jgi:hydrogenase-4 membrane subunit HyfE
MSTESVELGHGHSPAAWTAVIIMLVAFTIGAVAFFFEAPIVVWAAAVLAIVGLIVGWVMKRAGYGVGGSKSQPKGH